MTQTYFKAVRPDGFDFHTQSVDYGKAAKSRTKKIEHPRAAEGVSDAGRYFSVSTVATDCTGFAWHKDGGARLFEVEPTGTLWTPHPDSMPNKRATTGLKIIRELPAHMLFGVEGDRIVVLLDAFDALTSQQRNELRAAYSATYTAFRDAINAVAIGGRTDRAGLCAARYALVVRLYGWDGFVSAAYGAALALLCRPLVGDVFTQAEYDTLSSPWRKVIGEIHPDDKAVK